MKKTQIALRHYAFFIRGANDSINKGTKIKPIMVVGTMYQA